MMQRGASACVLSSARGTCSRVLVLCRMALLQVLQKGRLPADVGKHISQLVRQPAAAFSSARWLCLQPLEPLGQEQESDGSESADEDDEWGEHEDDELDEDELEDGEQGIWT